MPLSFWLKQICPILTNFSSFYWKKCPRRFEMKLLLHNLSKKLTTATILLRLAPYYIKMSLLVCGIVWFNMGPIESTLVDLLIFLTNYFGDFSRFSSFFSKISLIMTLRNLNMGFPFTNLHFWLQILIPHQILIKNKYIWYFCCHPTFWPTMSRKRGLCLAMYHIEYYLP